MTKGLYILILSTCLTAVSCFAQQSVPTPGKGSKINQVDNQGKRTGTWLNSIPENKGESAYTEFGPYQNGMKNGLWYKMNPNGDLLAIENFKKDYYDGEVKYFAKGQVTCIGLYRALNPDVVVDTIVVVEPVTGEESLVPVMSERGTVRHGTWRFYDEVTGSLRKIEEYQVDDMIYEEFFPMSKADSLYYERRNRNLPHMKKPLPNTKASKQVSYLR